MVLYKQLAGIRAKLDRSTTKTSTDNRDQPTMAENRVDKLNTEGLPGPATLMSRLVRAELEAEQLGGPVNRFFNRPVVLVALLLMCFAVLVWGFWPLSEDQLFQRGAKLMESESLYDMNRAWSEYLEPLETRYPNHPYKEPVASYRKKWHAAKLPRVSEAQRFFQQGEMQLKQGNAAGARLIWTNLIDVFGEVESEKEWVSRARRSLDDLDQAGVNVDRFKQVKLALERADTLRMEGKREEAERIWTGIERLYGQDPSAADLILEVQKARLK
jgi:hypothetical protein